ncbi:MAG: hypothetical protein D6687_04555 [Acidobacteria bacterium]|jgi:hypothetical protein|nr:MAG: hypothetical protein D6687_04555 [Acidobacteriota bacterium]GIU82935.1 MAG: hypothetical protein KatS3mg006_1999 [Pyrinomonadaceae bacterium]
MVIAVGSGSKTELKIWFCESCGCYHIKIGEMLLTLDRGEFTSLVNGLVDCYCSSFFKESNDLLDENQELFS